MSNELERATLALHDVDCGCPSKVHSEESWDYYRDAARAVIAALTSTPDVGKVAQVRAAFDRCGVIDRAGLDTQPSYSPMRQSAIERADRLWFDLNAILDCEPIQ